MKAKASTQWIERIIGEIIITLHIKHRGDLSFLKVYGLKEASNTIPVANFVSALRDLCENPSVVHFEHLAKRDQYCQHQNIFRDKHKYVDLL